MAHGGGTRLPRGSAAVGSARRAPSAPPPHYNKFTKKLKHGSFAAPTHVPDPGEADNCERKKCIGNNEGNVWQSAAAQGVLICICMSGGTASTSTAAMSSSGGAADAVGAGGAASGGSKARSVRVAVEGCCHGELDDIYAAVRRVNEGTGVPIDCESAALRPL